MIDKPEGITSHDVVNRVRRITGEKRVGHAGTLDPFATGLLVVGVGRMATKEMSKLVGLDKRYEAEFVLGAESDTDDRTGKIVPVLPLSKEELEGVRVETALKPFIGTIQQLPPTYSAIKIGGKKMYEAAREGKPLEAKLRTVTIYSITDIVVNNSTISLSIHCSTGTYIRSIARDLGRNLGVGGYVGELRRTSIGPFTIQEAVTIDFLKEHGAEQSLIPVQTLLTRL